MNVDAELNKILNNKTILVTGGTGTIGSEIIRQVLKYKPRAVRAFSNSENEMYELNEELCDREEMRYLMGDVRSVDSITRAMRGVQVVFHAAAMKHVPICEYNATEAKSVNVDGTENMLKIAAASGVDYLINISTDKAVDPFCTMGATKMLGERIIGSAKESIPHLIASNVRFGNVLASRGSIVPKVKRYLSIGRQIGITDEQMTRFTMTIADAIHLLLQALALARGSETFILKMKKVRVVDLIRASAEYFREAAGSGMSIDDFLSGPPGRRPGEKLSESLFTTNEAQAAIETDEMIILLPPEPISKRPRYEPHPLLQAHTLSTTRLDSEDGPFLSIEQIKEMLLKANL